MINSNLKNIDIQTYFDLTSKELDEIAIFETHDKNGCYIAPKTRNGHIYEGFQLLKKPRVSYFCNLTFFRSKITDKYTPRPKFFKTTKNGDIKETTKQKVIVELDGSEVADNFWKMISFLQQFKHLVDIGDFDKSFKVVNTDAYVIEFTNKKDTEKLKALQKLFKNTDFSENDIEAILKDDRKKNLNAYDKLLNNDELWKTYQEKYKAEMKGNGAEAVWHHFLQKHHWLLGLNADLKFIRDLIPEADLGTKNTSGSGSPKTDILGISDFTTLIELKTPNTKIFTKTKATTARANTWSFSSGFIDGISQCLAQKTAWEKTEKSIIQDDNTALDQNRFRTVDPKVIFIIGNKKLEIPETSRDMDILAKRDTFERFRRNNRNIDIITYDELYERADYIVNGRNT